MYSTSSGGQHQKTDNQHPCTYMGLHLFKSQPKQSKQSSMVASANGTNNKSSSSYPSFARSATNFETGYKSTTTTWRHVLKIIRKRLTKLLSYLTAFFPMKIRMASKRPSYQKISSAGLLSTAWTDRNSNAATTQTLERQNHCPPQTSTTFWSSKHTTNTSRLIRLPLQNRKMWHLKNYRRWLHIKGLSWHVYLHSWYGTRHQPIISMFSLQACHVTSGTSE